MKIGWRGYVSSRAINGQLIPQRVQNLVMRTYAGKTGIQYLLSATEYHIPGSFMMLESLYDGLAGLEGLLFYSMHQLPEKPADRRRLYATLRKAGSGLRFALEELSVETAADAGVVEDALICRALSRQADLSILSRR